jgi:hypothetical protein
MDYTQADLSFKIKKTLRYVRLYGISKTYIKIMGQYHKKEKMSFNDVKWTNPDCRNPDSHARCVAIVGCGNYSYSNIAYNIFKTEKNFLRCTYDTLPP